MGVQPKNPSAGSCPPAGRFAPSPTGPLHIGSLYTALASYLDARALGLRWRVRLDDLDVARNDPEAPSRILHTLEAHGLHWDGDMQRQSERIDRYMHALDELDKAGETFFCTCSRKDLAEAPVYPGRCRNCRTPVADAAIRVLARQAAVTYTDLIQGRQRVSLNRNVGDFVVRRRDGLIAYQLATAVDDGAPEIVRVLRGSDLLPSTPRQMHLMQLLGLQVPVYAHAPVLLNSAGQKWSKQTGAPPVNDDKPTANIRDCLALMGMEPPELELEALLEWAQSHWDIRRLRPDRTRTDAP